MERYRDHLRSARHDPRLAMRISRRSVVVLGAGAAAGALVGLSSRRAAAVLKLDVTQGNVAPVPIAVPEFIAVATADPAAGRNISQIIASNLARSGLFAPVDPAAYLERISNIDALPRFPDSRAITA